MATEFEYKERQLIPVWRNFSSAKKSLELNSSGNKENFVPNFDRLINDWNTSPSIVLASEIVSAAAISGKQNLGEYEQAQKYLEKNIEPSVALKVVINESVDKVIHSLDKSNITSSYLDLLLEDITVDNIDQLWNRISRKGVWNRIHQAKRLAIEQLSNPISWVDAAWHYTVDGQFHKAEKCMRIALSIDSNNRFVLRAATTLFSHFGDAAQAIFYLRKSSRTAKDPWLVSAHIAASSRIGRFSPFIKKGKELLLDSQISAFNLNELASSIAMEEYNSGALKKSRIYMMQALKRPNENTLAQFEWLSINDYRFPFEPSVFKKLVPQPFEANAFECLQNGKWEEAVMNAVRWFLDAPYNRLSVTLCVFLLTSFFEKYEDAIRFCHVGLLIHQNDPVLMNNLIYCHAMLGTQDQIPEIVRRYRLTDNSSMDYSVRMANLATLGLLLFREGEIQAGRELYVEALRIAAKHKDDYRGGIALINFAREMVLAKEPDAENFIGRIARLQKETTNPHIKYFCHRFFERIKSINDVIS